MNLYIQNIFFLPFIIIVLVFLILKLVCILTCGRCRNYVCLVGKTALITGGNSGIGYETALALASRGCKIIIADVVDATETRDKIIQLTNNKNIFTKKVDYQSFDSVRQLAKNILDSEEKLDILINNAGIGFAKFEVTEDGIPKVMQVNYFSHFLLTHLLVDLLKKSDGGKIIFTSSIMAFVNNLNKTNLCPKPENFTKGDQTVYCNSKMALIVASNYFAEKLKRFNITSNVLHPGLVKTQIYNKTISVEKFTSVYVLKFLTNTFGKTIEEGAQTIIHLATIKDKVTGKLFMDCRSVYQPPLAHNKTFCEYIWKQSESIVKLEESEKLE